MNSDQVLRAAAVAVVIVGTLLAIGEASAYGYAGGVKGFGSSLNPSFSGDHEFGWNDPDFAYGVNSHNCVLERYIDGKGEVAMRRVCG